MSASGQKILEYSGGAALAKVLEPLQKEGLAGIGAVLSNLWKLLAGIFSGKGFAWSEIVGGGVVADAGKKAGEVKDGAKDILNPSEDRRIKVAEALKKAPEEIKDKLQKDLAQWGYSSNDRTKSIKFNEVWNEYKPEIEKLLKTNEDAAFHDAKHNPLDSLVKSVTIPARMFMSLIAR